MVNPSTMCPSCMHPDAISNGTCRYCKKSLPKELPVGVLSPGVVLGGRYFTGLYLGSGGFGVTYRAYDLIANCAVAIKEYYPGASNWCSRSGRDPRVAVRVPEDFEYGLKHFQGEAKILRSLSDIPEVVRWYNTFEDNNTAYFAMELLDGQTLQDYLKTCEKELSFLTAVDLLMPVILGLQKIHEREALHRDIKPANIFLCRDGTIRILDFGASNAKGNQYAESFMPVVSEGYSPPEQCTISHEKGKQGPWSDIYAVAGTIYRCVTGRRPPSASMREAGDALDFDGGHISSKQREVLEKNLSLQPEKRSQNMLAFAQELLECLKTSEAETLRKQYPELQRKPAPKPHVVSNPGGVKPKPVPLQKTTGIPLQLRQAAAFCIDLLFFQGVPYALSRDRGGDAVLWLFAGFAIGTMISWLMTCSSVRGSPGEVICRLQVQNAKGQAPNQREALLYCLLRMFWPSKIVDAVSYFSSHQMLNPRLSGCSSVSILEGNEEAGQKELLLKITDGLYAGGIISIPPGRYTLGRYPDICNLVYPMTYNIVSRIQCVLVVDDAKHIFITDKSSHGTTVDNRRLGPEESAQAKVGSVIAFGKEKMTICYE